MWMRCFVDKKVADSEQARGGWIVETSVCGVAIVAVRATNELKMTFTDDHPC